MTTYKALSARLRDESGTGTQFINERVALMDKAADAIEVLESDLAFVRQSILTSEAEVNALTHTIAAVRREAQACSTDFATGALAEDILTILNRKQ